MLGPDHQLPDDLDLAVGISPSGHHVGILYRDLASQLVFFFHHLEEECLSHEHPGNRVRWVIPGFDADTASFVLPVLDLLYDRYVDRALGLPFGFSMDATFAADGSIRLSMQTGGFTCATFVDAVFAHAGLPLVDRSSWRQASPERLLEDQARRDRLLDSLSVSDGVRATQLRTHPTFAHVRATEVAAASSLSPHPVDYTRAEPAGRSLVEELTDTP